MIRILLAAVLTATVGITAAAAGGRSKDERAAWWQTMHQSKPMWQVDRRKPAAAAQPKAAAPAGTPAPTTSPRAQ